jgi:hypothetical protein
MPFKTLMTRICMLALFAKDEIQFEKSIDEKKELIERNLKEIQQKEGIQGNLTFFKEIEEEINYYKEKKIPHF